MKNKKRKPRGIKHKIREEKKREQRIGLAIIIAILITIITVSSLFIHSMLSSSQQAQGTGSTFKPRAAIVDHLSLTASNQTFIQTAVTTLGNTGFSVDYYQGEKVTVKFYRDLPTHGFRLLILRVHSALVSAGEPPVSLFTSEPYSKTKYVYEQLADQLGWVTYRFENGTPKEPTYFGISPLFIKHSMNGRFPDTLVIMMGCNGLTYTDMAEAFIEKGAKVYVSWNDSVLASHTDSATTHLLQYLFTQELTLEESLKETFKKVGVDPIYKSLLTYYPPEAGDYTPWDFIGCLVTGNTIGIRHIATPRRRISSYGFCVESLKRWKLTK
ncbi:MAG: hypothetical protein PVF15_10060 [Candidatus Bathyarchaeota archaeon]|jgi:hypothetical protein